MRQMGSPCSTSTVSGRVRHSPIGHARATPSLIIVGHVLAESNGTRASAGRETFACLPILRKPHQVLVRGFCSPVMASFRSSARAQGGRAGARGRKSVPCRIRARHVIAHAFAGSSHSATTDSRYDMGDHANVRAIDCEPTASAFAAGHCNEPGRCRSVVMWRVLFGKTQAMPKCDDSRCDVGDNAYIRARRTWRDGCMCWASPRRTACEQPRASGVFFLGFFHVARRLLPGTSGATMRRRSARHGRPRLPLRRAWRGGRKRRGSPRCTARASGLFSIWRADCCPAQVAPQGGKGRHDTGAHAWLGGVHGEAAASTGGRCDAPRVSKRGRRVRGQCGASVWSARHAWRHRATRVGVTCETTPGSVLFMASWPRQPGVAQTCRSCANASCGGAPQYFRRKTYIFIAYIYCLTFLYRVSASAPNAASAAK